MPSDSSYYVWARVNPSKFHRTAQSLHKRSVLSIAEEEAAQAQAAAT
jgi:hypothetical protein